MTSATIPAMIPICLVTGFLGSGKTTLLQQIVDSHRSRRFVYLVNEFAPADIDGRLLAIPEDERIAIVGGSIFCRCLVSEFIRYLRLIQEKYNQPENGIEGVIIEASGVAHPKVIQQMLQETRLDRVYQVHHIVSVIDPGSFLKLIHTLPTIVEQVEASDLILLNKIDCYPPETIDRAESELRAIHPLARIERTQFCQTTLDLFTPSALDHLQGDYALCADPHYAQTVLRSEKPIDWPRLKAAIVSLQNQLYRVKGFVLTPGGLLYADYSPSGWREEPIPSHPVIHSTELAVIVQGSVKILADTLYSRVAHGEYDVE